MEFGTAAHREVLGAGWPYVVSPWADYKTKAAQEWAAEQRDVGKVPIKPEQRERIVAMAAAIRTHPTAALLLSAEDVLAEHSFFWEDPDTGIMLRARFDAVKLAGRVVITDFKSAAHADPEGFAKAAANYRYHWQGVWYAQGVTHTLGDADPRFLFVAQEKEPPYLVGIYELPWEAIEAAQADIARARREYARCVEAGEWPGYQPGQAITTLDWPRWAR